ncbi:MAG: HEAT repeat domain-containing protein [Polyangiales bacterium]
MRRPPTVPRRALRAAALGCVIGCAGGLLAVCSDFGAHWLWLDTWPDRATLLVRLMGLEVPLGGAMGAVIGAVMGATEGAIERTIDQPGVADGSRLGDRLRALRLTSLCTPGLLWIGVSLFGGGKMSRLPARHALEVVACALLVAAMLAVAYAGHRLNGRALLETGLRRNLVLLALALGFLLDKLNQWVLPGLYDYLHAALSLSSFALYASAAWLLLGARLRGRASTALTLGLLPALAALGIGLLGTFRGLDQNQNVRVALLHPNVPHARALLQALAPFVIEPAQRREMEQARQRARLARAQSSRHARSAVGPVLDDAHVLLISVDALRPDHLGSYGYARPTSPQLDRFAEQSVLFERVYAPAPHSSYSLCSLMTSEYLHETLDLGQTPPQQTLARVFSDAGYHTAAFYSEGIFHTAAERLQCYERDAFGFALHDQVTYTAEQLTDRVLEEIDRTVARGEPNSFLWVHYFDVHEPYRSTHFGTSDLDRYDGEILHVDGEIARLVREARRRLKREVIVALTADHGEEFRDHGGVYHGSSLYEEQVRVPLMLNASALSPRRVRSTVKTLDLAPTLLGLVGLSPPPSMRGDDLRGLAVGQPSEAGVAFSAVIHKKMVVRWPYKLIADLRFGAFELYDLEHDPRERDNLADSRPEILASLRGEVYAWLDSLAPTARERDSVARLALDRGRLGDRRSVEPLCGLLDDEHASAADRAEAARILGRLSDERATPALLRALHSRSPRVSAESAIALGRMFDPHARSALRRLVECEDPQLRTRAGVSLARLRDTHAVPALVEALWTGQDDYERQEAVRWLGRLRDPRALDPLIEVLPEMRTRYLVPVALGMIGDDRAYRTLLDLLTWDRHSNVRDAAVQGLGLLGDRRAIPLLVQLATEDETLKMATESLVRLDALQSGAIGGADIVQGDPVLHDFENCHVGPPRHDWDYDHRTYCTTRGAVATLDLQVPQAVSEAPFGAIAALAIKRADTTRPVTLTLSIDGKRIDAVAVDGRWAEYRFMLRPRSLPRGRVEARLESDDPSARVTLDHLLLLPRTSEWIAERAE